MHLAHLARTVDLPGEDDQRPAPGGLVRNGDLDRVPKVARPVGVRLVRPALRAGEGNRLLGVEQAVDRVDGLFHRVGAVRHDDAGDVVAAALLADAAGQREGQLAVHVEARHAGELVQLEGRRLGPAQHAHELLPADGGDELAGRRVRPHGDRPARRDDHDLHGPH